MLNYLWGGMFLAGIIYGAFAGTLPQITEGLLSGAKEAVELCLSVAGIVAFWTGLMTVAKETGLLRGIAAAMRPFTARPCATALCCISTRSTPRAASTVSRSM